MQTKDFSWKTKDGMNMFAREWTPDGKVKACIALVHGLGEHIVRYDHVAKAFTDAGYAMVGFDLRGHGKSDGIRGFSTSNDAMMDDIAHNIELAKEKFPKVPVFLYGHSLGGNLVLFYTLSRKPELKGVIATSPGLGVAKPLPAFLTVLMNVLYKLAPATKINNTLDVTGLARDAQVVEKYTSDPLVHPFVSPRLAKDMFSNGDYILAHAGEFPLPLLVMQGTADRLVNPAKTKEFAKAAPLSKITYKEFEGHYHELHNEPDQAEILKVMVGWLDQEMK